MSKLKIMFLMPLYNQIPSESFNSFVNLSVDAQEYYDVNFITMTDLYTPYARQKLATQVLNYLETGDKLDYIFLLDQDHKYTFGDVSTLVDSLEMNKDLYDCMSGFYYYKDGSNRVVAYHLEGDNLEMKHAEDIKQRQGIKPIDAVGLGFCVMKPEVFQKMYKTYGNIFFACEHNPDKFVGEDIAFFRRAKKIGIRTAINTDIKIIHLGSGV